MCQIFVPCHLSCPHYRILWHPTLLSCSLARDAARRSSRPHDIYPCGSVSTLWNEDLCPYCLCAKLSKGASKYVKDCLIKWPLRYEPVYTSGRYLMRWVGRAREEFDMERRMDRRASSAECCGNKSTCTCGKGKSYTAERRLSNSEYLQEKARRRNNARYFGRAEGYEKGMYYDCKPNAKRQDVETVYERKRKETVYDWNPKEKTREAETNYACRPRGWKEIYYTTECPRTKTVYVETGRERMKREKEEERIYESYMKGGRSGRTMRPMRGGYDIDEGGDVDVDVGFDVEERPRSKKTKNVSFADDKYYYGYYY